MRSLSLIYIFCWLIFIPAGAQDIIYISKWKSESSRDVVFVGSPAEADLCINVVHAKTDIDAYHNAWYFTERKSEATYVLRVSDRPGALKIYLYDPPVDYLSSKWRYAYQKFFPR